jgi:hypothetical protein
VIFVVSLLLFVFLPFLPIGHSLFEGMDILHTENFRCLSDWSSYVHKTHE